MSQIESIAHQQHANRVTAIHIGMGPLSGVEERLLKNAYPLASAGTIASDAKLHVRTTAIRVRCTQCQSETDAKPNRLVCGHCGDWRTELISGDELLLIRVELDGVKATQH